MSLLLDTNIVSESTKPKPDPQVSRWLAEVDENEVCLSVVTLAEIRFGIERMPSGTRRRSLDRWLKHDLPLRFEGRILPINSEVAHMWGVVTARARELGRPIAIMDAFLAATAVVHHLTLVTRNTSDFSALRIPVLDPFTGTLPQHRK